MYLALFNLDKLSLFLIISMLNNNLLCFPFSQLFNLLHFIQLIVLRYKLFILLLFIVKDLFLDLLLKFQNLIFKLIYIFFLQFVLVFSNLFLLIHLYSKYTNVTGSLLINTSFRTLTTYRFTTNSANIYIFDEIPMMFSFSKFSKLRITNNTTITVNPISLRFHNNFIRCYAFYILRILFFVYVFNHFIFIIIIIPPRALVFMTI